MGRGLGERQRAILLALARHEDPGVPLLGVDMIEIPSDRPGGGPLRSDACGESSSALPMNSFLRGLPEHRARVSANRRAVEQLRRRGLVGLAKVPATIKMSAPLSRTVLIRKWVVLTPLGWDAARALPTAKDWFVDGMTYEDRFQRFAD